MQERLLNQPIDPDIRDTREGEATLLCLSCHHGALGELSIESGGGFRV